MASIYLDQQHLDTTTPTGKLLFHVTGAFAEFERSMIRQRVNAGLGAIKARIKRDGHFTTKAGIVRRRLGRPGAEPTQIERARQELANGVGIGKVARLTGLGTGTVHKLTDGFCKPYSRGLNRIRVIAENPVDPCRCLIERFANS